MCSVGDAESCEMLRKISIKGFTLGIMRAIGVASGATNIHYSYNENVNKAKIEN